MPNPLPERFVRLLQERPHFDGAEALAKLAAEAAGGTALLDAVIDTKLAPKHVACSCWATAVGVSYVDPLTSVVSDDAVACIPAEVATKARVIGLYLLADVLTVAMAAPDDQDLLRRLAHITQKKISPVFALEREIVAAISIHYSTGKTLEENLASIEQSGVFLRGGEATVESLDVLAKSKGLVQVLDEIIYHAIRERASDLHFEPRETECRLRFRVDGKLRSVLTYSRPLHRAILSRLKILGGLNIAESRFPQDGRFSLPIGAESASFRLSTVPSHRGEKAVVRVLPLASRTSTVTLDGMMMSQSILQQFRRIIHNPNGVVFVTGPTGSGKTTTLYAALQEINSPEINIATIEDPVEIELADATQTQVSAPIDLSFAKVLRSLLRQDPDVILVGEIRDLETAQIATEAALTGHIVFATLHTNTAPQAVTRLMELGVDPCMVAPSVIGVLGQRLAARICTECKEAYQPSFEVLSRYFYDPESVTAPFYRGRGCVACRGTGYRGRVAFHELVTITDEIRTLVAERRSVQEVAKAAAQSGYHSLRYDGLKKVLLGLTTIEEIEEATPFEWTS